MTYTLLFTVQKYSILSQSSRNRVSVLVFGTLLNHGKCVAVRARRIISMATQNAEGPRFLKPVSTDFHCMYRLTKAGKLLRNQKARSALYSSACV